ncbi:MAG TPA: A24 family peptidase [Bryobacterales bacterium]|nr:A24 family peptidase [Bryobacterales bacterium]
MMQYITWWLTFLVLLIAALTDLHSRRIPNLLVAPFLAAGLVAGGVTGGWEGVTRSLAGIGLGAAAAAFLCYLRGMGLGDLKLLAAVGAWIGPAQMVSALVMTAIAGGFLALAYAIRHRSLGRCLDSTADLLAEFPINGIRPHRTAVLGNPEAIHLPYAVAIAIGTMFSFYAV